MKKALTTLFVILIVAFAIFSFFRYFYLLKINYSLELKLTEINDRIVDLENTKKNLEEVLEKKKDEYLKLSQERQTLVDKLQNTEKQLNQKNTELENVKGEFEQTKLKLESLNNDYSKLNTEVEKLKEEKNFLQSKFNSLDELKEAYNILKKKLRQAKLEQQRQKADKDLGQGNKGYLLWQGEPTTEKKVKIEITPVY